MPDDGQPAARATQEADYGGRGKGYIFGAFRPATYVGRTTVDWVTSWSGWGSWLPAGESRVYAIVDNVNTHHTTDALL